MQWAPLPRRDEPQYKYLDYSAKPTRRIVIKARKRKRVQWAPLPRRGVAEENKGRAGSRGCDSSVGGRAAKEARLPKGGTMSAPEMNEADKANKEARLPKGGTRSAPEMNKADKTNLSREAGVEGVAFQRCSLMWHLHQPLLIRWTKWILT